jgi:hypothetical protein
MEHINSLYIFCNSKPNVPVGISRQFPQQAEIRVRVGNYRIQQRAGDVVIDVQYGDILQDARRRSGMVQHAQYCNSFKQSPF